MHLSKLYMHLYIRSICELMKNVMEVDLKMNRSCIWFYVFLTQAFDSILNKLNSLKQNQALDSVCQRYVYASCLWAADMLTDKETELCFFSS